MQYIRRICFLAAYPIGNILPEAATYLGIKSYYIIRAKMFQSSFCPVSHLYHDCFLIHVEIFSFIELQAAFPCVTKTIWPLAGVAIFLMPDEFLSPKPTLLPERKD